MTKTRGFQTAALSTLLFMLAAGLVAQLTRVAGERNFGLGVDEYPLLPHVAVMGAVFALALLASTALARKGAIVASVLTSTGAALGPLTLIAAPWSAAMMRSDGRASLQWTYCVAAVATAWLLITVHLVVKAGRGVDAATTKPVALGHRVLYPVALVVILELLIAIAPLTEDPGHGQLIAQLLVAYSLLIAGLFTASVRAPRAGMAISGLSMLMAFGLWAAYRREGGWPGVAGWEYGTSPIIATVGTSALLILAPVLGTAIGLVVSRRQSESAESDELATVVTSAA